MIKIKSTEGHYTIKRVDKLPKIGNANWLYAIRGPILDKLYRWDVYDREYEIIVIGAEEFIPEDSSVTFNSTTNELTVTFIDGSVQTTVLNIEAIITTYTDSTGTSKNKIGEYLNENSLTVDVFETDTNIRLEGTRIIYTRESGTELELDLNDLITQYEDSVIVSGTWIESSSTIVLTRQDGSIISILLTGINEEYTLSNIYDINKVDLLKEGATVSTLSLDLDWLNTNDELPSSIGQSIYRTGNVGIGIEPSHKLHLYGTSNNAVDIVQQTDAAREIQHIARNGTSGINWKVVGTASTVNIDGYQLEDAYNSNQIYIGIDSQNRVGILNNEPTTDFDINGKTRVRDIPTGTVSDEIVTTDVDGNLRKVDSSVFSGGLPVDFYEEGTWTPVMTPVGSTSVMSYTYTTNTGTFKRQGEIVFFTINIEGINSVGAPSSNNWFIINLPHPNTFSGTCNIIEFVGFDLPLSVIGVNSVVNEFGIIFGKDNTLNGIFQTATQILFEETVVNGTIKLQGSYCIASI